MARKTFKKTLVKQGDRLDAYVPGEELRMRWNKVWKITSVMYSSATKQTYIRLKFKE